MPDVKGWESLLTSLPIFPILFVLYGIYDIRDQRFSMGGNLPLFQRGIKGDFYIFN